MSSVCRKALIEIGTNSVKFLIAEKDGHLGKPIYIEDSNEITRIGEGLAGSGRLGKAPMDRTLDCVRRFIAKADTLGVRDVSAVATMALRRASNSNIFVDRLKAKTGLSLRVLSGKEEAMYSFYGVAPFLPGGCCGWYFDTGGGSTEFVHFKDRRVVRAFSLEVGAVSVTEKFMLSRGRYGGGIEAALRWIERSLVDGGLHCDKEGGLLVGSGGNVITMAAVSLAPKSLSSSKKIRLSLFELDKQIDLYGSVSERERRLIPGMDPDRAPIILAGTCIARSIFGVLEVKEMLVSSFGLRHGFLNTLFD
ncbi:Ppx/GppA phosphatase [Dethiosulfovibrio peptidovorans DSM 11002]|uniref:Ppx/GppA phosphatase n=1 Tax=Dethiosulfovibrio peptidovorans DSM 11002 TaxID=469381 RepID=D2Z892_9BACT|nr:Ppx/GppA phosphatase [Dethiosulfovibrio peptidovorans]EFC91689.1 Ppx/GppA phosphatase [Dethiosulfovibrio peptidovorans DSM 11002]